MRRAFAMVAATVFGVLPQMACATLATDTAITPVTGIVIRADALVSEFGCGLGDSEVYRYAAIVIDADGRRVASAIYDCFADGAFVNLFPATNSGSLDFVVHIRAWNRVAYDAANTDRALDNADTATLETLTPTWSAECKATQQEDVQVLALCAPLKATTP